MPNVSLTPELEGFAERCVASGRYGNVSEVMRAALRLLADQEARRTAFTEMLERVEREADEKGWLTADQVDAEFGELFQRRETFATELKRGDQEAARLVGEKRAEETFMQYRLELNSSTRAAEVQGILDAAPTFDSLIEDVARLRTQEELAPGIQIR
jgi:antitoxin ParD1/3/4